MVVSVAVGGKLTKLTQNLEVLESCSNITKASISAFCGNENYLVMADYNGGLRYFTDILQDKSRPKFILTDVGRYF